MAVQLAFWANLAISMAYFGITVAIVVPVTRAGQLWSNRLATATAMIFFSCAVGHGLHSGYLAALAEAGANGDAQALETQAHSFRGVIANLGATGPAEICQRLEDLGRSGPLGPMAIATAADDLDRLLAS
jgi:hypothetical protein